MTGLEPSTSSQTSVNYNIVSIYSDDDIKAITNGDGTTTNKSYSRSSSSSSFTNVALITNYWNNSSQTYSYDLGWGLYDSNGNLKSTHTVASNYSLQGTYYTYPTSSIAVGSGISSGTYYLKPICRLSGTSTWRLARGANVNYVKATITASTLTTQIYDPLSVQNLKINSVTTPSIKKVGSPLELKLGVSNQGLTDYNYIYMWVNGTLTSATTTDIAIGGSGTVSMFYIPSQSGTNTFRFTADRAGNKTLYTIGISISAASAASFTATNTGTLSGTTINVKSVLTNTGSATYNDYILARLLKGQPNSGNTGYYDNAMSQQLYLNSGGTKTLNFSFTGLEHGERYFVIIFYYSNGEPVQVGYTTSWLTPSLLDVNEDGVVNAADVTAIYNSILNGDVTYRGYSDVNGDGVVNAADVTTIYNKILGY